VGVTFALEAAAGTSLRGAAAALTFTGVVLVVVIIGESKGGSIYTVRSAKVCLRRDKSLLSVQIRRPSRNTLQCPTEIIPSGGYASHQACSPVTFSTGYIFLLFYTCFCL